MKKISYIILLLILIQFHSYSQNFIDTSKIWTVSVRYDPRHSTGTKLTLLFKFGEDTIISNVEYTKMYYSENPNKINTNFSTVFKEEVPGKVYIRSMPFGREHLIYDFNLEEGDTSSHNDINNRVVMDSIIVRDFGIEQRKYFYSHYLTDSLWSVLWVEGVGSLFDPTISDEKGYSGSFNTLICFEENGEHIYLNPAYTACDASTGTAIEKLQEKPKLIEVIPFGNETIQINSNNFSGEIIFYTAEGKQLLKQEVRELETQICLPNQGIVIYHFTNEKGETQTGKIMVK